MQYNQNYPWYLQKSKNFTALYDGLYNAAKDITPLDVYKFVYPSLSNIAGLLVLARIWRITGDPRYSNALLYNMDEWSGGKVWTGGLGELKENTFRRLVAVKAYMQGKQISLTTLSEAFDIIFDEESVDVTVSEGFMSFTINISGDKNAIRAFIEMRSLDPVLFGKTPGIHIDYNYNLD